MEIGKPDSVPEIVIEPIQDPVPRENPRPIPEETPLPERAPVRERDPELVPA